MTSPTNTRRATDGQQAEGSSRDLPHRIDQEMLWRDVRQGLLFMAVCVAIGVGIVVFMIQPSHVQAMLIYAAIVTGCVSLIVAQLRRKARGR